MKLNKKIFSETVGSKYTFGPKLFSLIVLIIFSFTAPSTLSAQVDPSDIPNESKPAFSIGLYGGYDHPLFSLPWKELSYEGGLQYGANVDYKFPFGLGARVNYHRMTTTPVIAIPNDVFLPPTFISTTNEVSKLKRDFIGLGPTWSFGKNRSRLLIGALFGTSYITKGEALSELNAFSFPLLMNTGIESRTWSAKGELEWQFELFKNLQLTLGAYYIRHFNAHLDDVLSLKSVGPLSIAHGEMVFDNVPNPYTLVPVPANITPLNPENPTCYDLSSVGLNLGIRYTFGKRSKKPKIVEVQEPTPEPACVQCTCPDDKHKVIITVRDEISQRVIPNADVALTDKKGNILTTGKTNSFGVVDLGELGHGAYDVSGLVYGIKTSTASIDQDEFQPNEIIRKEVLYKDLRFILKGTVVNRSSRMPEPGCLVNLTNNGNGQVDQDNSNRNGEFAFRLDQNSSYKVVGIKENRLSDIENSSTIGLTRSTTLFVDLELGVEDFDCSRGIELDIKYELDKWFLTSKSKYELDKLVRYLIDHNVSSVELSSHTDSRGSGSYNEDLSSKRAKSSADYIKSRGVPSHRIIARGYGEKRLLNRCADGVNCSETEHAINRRTEAKLICN